MSKIKHIFRINNIITLTCKCQTPGYMMRNHPLRYWPADPDPEMSHLQKYAML